MKFYNRDKEIVQLHDLSHRAYAGQSSMTFLIGRRRIGKTELLKYAYASDPNFIYFFVSRKSIPLLCEEFKEVLSTKFSIPSWVKTNSLLSMLEYILQQSNEQPLTLVFDEFQDFRYIDPSFFSSLQNLWDSYKNKAKIHFICCGSIYSMMCNIFENSKEPLFGRAETKIYLKPFKYDSIKKILTDEKQYSPQNLLTVYTIVGGVPRYLELLQRNQAWNLKQILNLMLNENSFFVNEGKDILIDEFGKDYKVYFSILSLIASGKTSRSAIESVLQISVGGYLDNLENEFSVLQKHIPIFAKNGSRTQKYYIKDNFLNFWFRYFHKHQSALEIGNYKYIIDIITDDFTTYSGKYLEFLFRDILAASGLFNTIGSYWEKDGQNEIDLIACNERDKKMLIGEIKLQRKNISLPLLERKSTKIVNNHQNYEIQYQGFSLQDLDGIDIPPASTAE